MKPAARIPKPLLAQLAGCLLLGASPPGFCQETTLAFIPPPPPLLSEPGAEERAAADRALRMRFFTAIAEDDRGTLSALFNDGIDPNVTLPGPVPPDFAKRFTDERLRYYVTQETGVTGLMMATALGNQALVRYFLLAGADPWRMTKRHRTYALWLAAKYGHIEIMRSLMGIEPGHESLAWQIEIDLAAQKVWVWHQGRIVQSAPISTGRTSHPTPTGNYLVTEKHKMWKSTLYRAKMPYFLRLSCGDFGLHEGVLPGYPASHGCIRLPGKVAKELFAEVPIGTLVKIR